MNRHSGSWRGDVSTRRAQSHSEFWRRWPHDAAFDFATSARRFDWLTNTFNSNSKVGESNSVAGARRIDRSSCGRGTFAWGSGRFDECERGEAEGTAH